ncbi:hypothetical protein [Actinobaculum sp. 352]|uniref:hypothetical protein n=1 Tax=Actinobaculum sp. 352 TaxID=2490946 RepID=UPI000F7E8562|nr:hypothetical protein [Actinobaculum sp. 352]RTE49311.1 hypothetical protein EKN07_07025 [Actinobaculum sp. 352]
MRSDSSNFPDDVGPDQHSSPPGDNADAPNNTPAHDHDTPKVDGGTPTASNNTPGNSPAPRSDTPTPRSNTPISNSVPTTRDDEATSRDAASKTGEIKQPTQSQAQDALDTLGADRAALAARAATPLWYHPILGMIAGAMTFGLAIQSHYPAFTGFLVFSILAILLLERTYTAIYGVSAMPSGRRSKAYYYTRLFVLLFTMATAGMIGLAGKPLSWCIPVVAIQFILLVTLGHRQDDAMRREIAQGE